MSFAVILQVLLSTTMHASWNFLSKKNMPSASFFCISSLVAAICWCWAPFALGVPEVLFSSRGVMLWSISLLCETIYFAGLFKAYAATDMSLAYPMARALPVLLVAGLTALIYPGRYPGVWGCAGLVVVFGGCLLMPLKKFRDFRFKNYCSRAMIFILLAAVGTTGYTLIDAEIIKMLSLSSGFSSMRAAFFWSFWVNAGLFVTMAVLVAIDQKEYSVLAGYFSSLRAFAAPAGAGVLSSLAYLLILDAMTKVSHLGFLQAFRQMSLPIGMLLGIFILKEPQYRPKVVGISAIVAGLVIIALLG